MRVPASGAARCGPRRRRGCTVRGGRQRGRSAIVALGAGVLVALTAGCAGGPDLSADSTTFDGLDPAVVAEVRASDVAWGKVETEPERTRASMAQGIARNYVQCRAAYEAYASWVATGQVPPVPAIPEVAAALEPANTAIVRAQADIAGAVEAGDPAALRDFLVGEARCGEWIPVDPEDPSATIADAVRALD